MEGARTSITACIVLYESARPVAALLESLRGQTVPVDQLVCCLNGIDDGSIRLIEKAWPGARILHRPDNPGFAGGLNACLAEVTTSHVLVLNPDIILEPGYVEACLAVFADEPDAGGVAGELLRPRGVEGDRIDSAGFVAEPWLRIVDRASGSSSPDAFVERESVVGICAAAALFDRAALVSVAEDGRVMDEDFWMYKEDQDLCLRLREVGRRLFFDPRARARHSRGFAGDRRSRVPLELRRHSLKNRYLILLKHWRWREHVWTLPFLAVFEVFLFLALALREPRTMKGYLLAIRLLPRMLAKRRRWLDRTDSRSGRLPAGRVVIPVLPY